MASGPRGVRRGRRPLKVALVVLLLVVAALLSTVAGAYVALARALPSLELGERIASPQATKIYDASPTPVLLAELRGLENRDVLSADQIPQVMRDAIVAVEDPRFYVHKGVDFVAILRAAWARLRHQEVVQGGSTITQHLVKDAFITDQQTPAGQVRAATLAYRLESRWSKEKILNEYLNVIYFGSGAYGIQAAARSYFGVDAKDLTVAQAALLAGVPEAPSVYSPRRDPEAALARRDLVLNKMYQQRYISSEQLQTALVAPLELAPTGPMVGVKAPYWVELVREQLVARYGSSLVLGGGLRVYTSLDLGIQQAADEAVETLLHQSGDPAVALVAIDVRTGRLVAMVGGSDFSEIQFNLATQGERSPGSALNPFVLVTAFAKGISPDATYAVGSAAEGSLTLAKAMANSSAAAFDRLMIEVGPDSVAITATDMGMGDITKGVSPLEMARAYATLANGGSASPHNSSSTPPRRVSR